MRIKKHRFSRVDYIIQEEPSIRLAIRVLIALSPNRKQLTLSQKDSTVISLRGPHVWWQPGFIGSHCGSLQAPTPRFPTRSSSVSALHALTAPHVTDALPQNGTTACDCDCQGQQHQRLVFLDYPIITLLFSFFIL